jgi:hypothetical protein
MKPGSPNWHPLSNADLVSGAVAAAVGLRFLVPYCFGWCELMTMVIAMVGRRRLSSKHHHQAVSSVR